MSTLPSFDEASVETLRAGFTGVVLSPRDDSYDEARRLHNALVDKHPAVIARCLSAADVVEALAFAREAAVGVSVRGGGHNVAGRALADGAVAIDLSLMKGLLVDPKQRRARVQSGVTWREFNRETGLHGLASTGGVISTTGVAGLTLGGGLGWLMGTHGLSVDNLRAVQLVTANGQVVEVCADEHPDLFWALRGGGGNFGVAVMFEFELHPLTEVLGGLVAYPFSLAGEGLRFFRDFAASMSDELAVMPLLVHAPDGQPLIAFAICHTGVREAAEAEIRPLLELGTPAMAEVGPMPYPLVNTLLDEGFPPGVLNYWKSSFLDGLSDDIIETLVAAFAECPSDKTGIAIEYFHGAVTRVPVEATAVPHREPGFNLLIASVWTEAAASEANIAWSRETYAGLEPYFRSRRYVNYLDDDDAEDAVSAAFGPNYGRLREIKRMYDPDNVFRSTHNIVPA
jgi:FAD/FMN-containing dehydrogenase